MTLIYNTRQEYPNMHVCANLVIPSQICDELFCRQAKMAKMTLKVKVNDPYFQYQLRVSQDAYLSQI